MAQIAWLFHASTTPKLATNKIEDQVNIILTDILVKQYWCVLSKSHIGHNQSYKL